MAQIASEIRVVPAPTVPFNTALPRWRVLLWGTLLTLVVGAIAALYLSYIGSVATSGYGIQRLQAERDAWRTRNDQLRVELGKARSLTWVEHEAVGRLKMQRATGLTYLKLDEPGPAVAAPAENTSQAQATSPR